MKTKKNRFHSSFFDSLSDHDRVEWLKRAQRQKARNSLLNFILHTKPDYQVNWHHELICADLDDFLVNPDRTRLMVFVGPGRGKECADSTPVLTANRGWTTHGELTTNDYVFHPSGKPVKVIALSEKTTATMEFEFSNGDRIKCHKNHEWTMHHASYGEERTYESKHWLKENKFGKPIKLYSDRTNGKKEYIYKVRRNGALQFGEKHLPIHPYLLGLWLGDGKSSDAVISRHKEDIAPIKYCESLGYTVSCEWEHGETGVVNTSFAKNGFMGLIRELNLFKNKHIPETYLRSSVEQREQLLAGLIDSDGWLSNENKFGFANTNESLINGFTDLIKGLGWNPSVHKREPKLSTSGIQGKQLVYEVNFVTDRSIPTQLSRKKLKVEKYQLRRWSLIGVRELDTSEYEQGHCIQIDSEDGLYLVGRNLTTTHNSEIVSRRLPSYYLGKNPTKRIIAASYASDLASSINREVQRIIDDPAYHGVFPDTALNSSNVKTNAKGSYVRTSDKFEIVKHGGYYKSAGVGQGITGMRFDLGLIDDPVKDAEEARSPTKKKRVWEWYDTTFSTRAAPGAKIIVIMTRWDEGDLAGRLLANAAANPDAEQWDILCFPEEYDPDHPYIHPEDPRTEFGQILWPEFYPEKEVKTKKASSSSKVWASMFQQLPSPDGGVIFEREWFQLYDDLPEIQYKVISLDATFKDASTSDFVAIGVWGVNGADKYLLDMKKERLSIIDTIAEILKLHSKYSGVKYTLIEDKANGPAIISMLKKKLPKIIPFSPKESKNARANAVAPYFEAGNVHVPNPFYGRNRTERPWCVKGTDTYIEELVAFPFGANDDLVDMTTQFLLKEEKSSGWVDDFIRGSDNLKQKADSNYTEKLAGIMGWDID